MGISDQGYVPRSHAVSLCSTELMPATPGKYFRLSFTEGHESLIEGVSWVPSTINNINILKTIYSLPSKIKLNRVSIVGKSHSIKKNKSHGIIYSKVLAREYNFRARATCNFGGVFSHFLHFLVTKQQADPQSCCQLAGTTSWSSHLELGGLWNTKWVSSLLYNICNWPHFGNQERLLCW